LLPSLVISVCRGYSTRNSLEPDMVDWDVRTVCTML
jgi:hypothetical protein